MTDVRLYAFECGTLSLGYHWIHAGQTREERYVIPVPFYVITHPMGLTIVDGGNAAAVAVDQLAHWGPELSGIDGQIADMAPEDACVQQVQKIGLNPADFRFVVQTHFHADHTGAVAALDEFSNAQVVANRRNWEYLHHPEWPHALDYIAADFDKPVSRLHLLEDEDDHYDLYGDGTVVPWRTPGHTPGHQSVEVRLRRSGSVILTGDAAYTVAHWKDESVPAIASSMPPGQYRNCGAWPSVIIRWSYSAMTRSNGWQ